MVTVDSEARGPGGVTWVLFRGLGRDALHWNDLPQKLAQAMPGSRVLTPDLPGTGVLFERKSPLAVTTIAKVVRESLFGVQPPTALNLVGLSLGSMVALAWAQTWPSEVNALALVSPSVGGLCPPWWRCQPRALAAFAGIGCSANGAKRERKVLRLTSSNPEVRARALGPWTDIAVRHPVSRTNLARQLLAASTFRPHLAPLPMATLVLAGQQDRIVDVRCAHKMGGALGATVHVHPTAGHDVPLDDPSWVAQQLMTFCENVTKAI
ncbi:MAG: alpha/beta hydrolase [Deltaproteobacteria bacterium]|nr:alpha/beta hydrolase [Deltaproteobacteria bacterium]